MVHRYVTESRSLIHNLSVNHKLKSKLLHKNQQYTFGVASDQSLSKEYLPFSFAMSFESSWLTGVLFEEASVDFKSRFTDRARVVEEREFFVQIALDLLLTPPLEAGDTFLRLCFCSLVDWALFLAIFWHHLADALSSRQQGGHFRGFPMFSMENRWSMVKAWRMARMSGVTRSILAKSSVTQWNQNRKSLWKY